MGEDRDDPTVYKVVVNHEEQYSIWPATRENPLGWRDAGKEGPKADGYAPTEPAEADGAKRSGGGVGRGWRRI